MGGSKANSQEHAAAAQSVDHPIVKNTRPEYPSADERIDVFTLSAVDGGDGSDTGEGIDKVYRRFVHCLCEKRGKRTRPPQAREREREKKKSGGKVRDGRGNTYQSFQV